MKELKFLEDKISDKNFVENIFLTNFGYFEEMNFWKNNDQSFNSAPC